MITKTFNKALVVWQESREGYPELPIVVHVDNGGTIVLSQEGRDIVLAPEHVGDLRAALRRVLKP